MKEVMAYYCVWLCVDVSKDRHCSAAWFQLTNCSSHKKHAAEKRDDASTTIRKDGIDAWYTRVMYTRKHLHECLRFFGF